MMVIIRSFIVGISLLCLWQIAVTLYQIPDYILPSPLQVLITLFNSRSLLFNQSIITLVEIILGFVSGILIGCCAGFLLAFFRPLALWFLPLLIISQTIPTFAIAPLLVIWFGYGMASKVVTAIIMIFFPVTSAFYDGLQQTKTSWLDLAKVMQAKKWRLFWFIRVPASLPHLASGIRIAAVVAPIGAVVGEWVGSSQGLGYLMLNANARMQIDMLFAALVVMIAMALGLYFCIDQLLRYFVPWQNE